MHFVILHVAVPVKIKHYSVPQNSVKTRAHMYSVDVSTICAYTREYCSISTWDCHIYMCILHTAIHLCTESNMKESHSQKINELIVDSNPQIYIQRSLSSHNLLHDTIPSSRFIWSSVNNQR